MDGRMCVVSVLLCLFCGASGLPRIDPIVTTNVGVIRGLPATDGDYSMFMGIPYATVDPLNPFGVSIPHPGFESTFDAFDDSAECPQREEFNLTLVGTLDCLHLNVYVPNTASSENRVPVFVWIHGGGMNYGSGSRFKHGPKFLVKHDVIVVTFNYRLGVYGFQCLEDPRVPGNQGLKDQLTALRWIKNNIGAFGGDSDRITIAGQSAGGVSVDYHLTYAKEDLFNNVIIQSGTSFAPFIVRDQGDPEHTTALFRLAEHFGLSTNNLDEALEFLRTIDTNLMVEASSLLGLQSRACVEKEFDNVERFITAQPAEVPLPNITNRPILIGYASNERGSSFENMPPPVVAQLDVFSQFLGLYDFNSEIFADIVDNVRRFYLGDDELSWENRQRMLDFVSDFGYFHPTTRRIQSYLDNGASNLYQYVFSYDGDRNFEKVKNNIVGVRGAGHEDELGYMFDMGILPETPTPEDQLTIDRITTLWTNFVKYGNPTPEVTEMFPVQWPASTDNIRHYLDLDSEVFISRRPFHRRMSFWDLFFSNIDELF